VLTTHLSTQQADLSILEILIIRSFAFKIPISATKKLKKIIKQKYETATKRNK
jgi:hypothetical protein